MPLTLMNSSVSIRMWLGAMVTIWTFHGHFIQDRIRHLKCRGSFTKLRMSKLATTRAF